MWRVKPLPLHVSRWDVKLRSHECFLKTASLFPGVTELSQPLLLLMKTRKTLPEDDITADLCLRSPSRIWLPAMMQETHFADGSGGAAGSRVRLDDEQKYCCVFNELAGTHGWVSCLQLRMEAFQPHQPFLWRRRANSNQLGDKREHQTSERLEPVRPVRHKTV